MRTYLSLFQLSFQVAIPVTWLLSGCAEASGGLPSITGTESASSWESDSPTSTGASRPRDTEVQPEDTGPQPRTTDEATIEDSGGDTATDSDMKTTSDDDYGTFEESTEKECGFGYDDIFGPPAAPPPAAIDVLAAAHAVLGPDGMPSPRSTFLHRPAGVTPPPPDIVMPNYSDDMPLFERGRAWEDATRCYETPVGVQHLDEDEAYALYRTIAEKTTGVPIDDTPGVRSVVGVRGAYPGTFAWHGNAVDLFNDTLVLMWIDGDGAKHVREFAANTDLGVNDYDTKSFLRPNRRYHYINGWHGSQPYNALQIAESDYAVRDDANSNGHWDSDRNGWLSPDSPKDYDRTGSMHNIHMGPVNAPLGTASVGIWSAGCQVIPGMASWTEFIDNAWTGEGDDVSYYLVDVRDIPNEIWHPCTPDGTHACPYKIESFPFNKSGDTSAVDVDAFDSYSCAPSVDESGREVVYVLTVDSSGTLEASVECADPVDVDVHLLDADDPKACLARNHTALSQRITPGRYFIVVDSFVSDGVERDGAYTLKVTFD